MIWGLLRLPLYYIPLSIAMGFGLAFLIVNIQVSKLKTVVKKVNAAIMWAMLCSLIIIIGSYTEM